MGDKGKGKDKGNGKKAAKPSAKGGLRPHEQRLRDATLNQARVTTRPTSASAAD